MRTKVGSNTVPPLEPWYVSEDLVYLEYGKSTNSKEQLFINSPIYPCNNKSFWIWTSLRLIFCNPTLEIPLLFGNPRFANY